MSERKNALVASSGARISVRRPDSHRIQRFVAAQRRLDFTYQQVGSTQHIDQPGTDYLYGDYNVDRRRISLGRGDATYRRACAAVKGWRMFELGWVSLCWPNTRICPGSAVAVLARVSKWWVLSAARIAYVVDETGDVDRFGFAYGTLPGHVMRGEERFLVEWDRTSDAVSFEILAASKPSSVISWMGYPVVRRLQSRFQHEATAAMRSAVE